MPKNIYKVGGCIYVHETGADLNAIDFPTIVYVGFETVGTDIILFDHIQSSTDFSIRGESRSSFEGTRVAIADVRDSVGAAIGGQTKSEVRNYIAGLFV